MEHGERYIMTLLDRAQTFYLRAALMRGQRRYQAANVYARQADFITAVARLLQRRVHTETRGGTMKRTWGFMLFTLVTLLSVPSYAQQEDNEPRQGQQMEQKPKQRPGNTSEQRTAQAEVAEILAKSWDDVASHVPAAMGTRKTVTLQKPIGTLPDGRIVFVRLVTETPDNVTNVERQAGREGTSNDGKEGVPGRTWNEKIQRWQDSETGRLLPDIQVGDESSEQK